MESGDSVRKQPKMKPEQHPDQDEWFDDNVGSWLHREFRAQVDATDGSSEFASRLREKIQENHRPSPKRRASFRSGRRYAVAMVVAIGAVLLLIMQLSRPVDFPESRVARHPDHAASTVKAADPPKSAPRMAISPEDAEFGVEIVNVGLGRVMQSVSTPHEMLNQCLSMMGKAPEKQPKQARNLAESHDLDVLGATDDQLVAVIAGKILGLSTQ